MFQIAAFLRRSLELLDWIESHCPAATARLGDLELGLWHEIAPRWRIDGQMIRFQYLHRGRGRVVRLSSVRPAPGGATLRIWPRSEWAEDIHVEWGVPSGLRDPGGTSLLKAARVWAACRFPGSRVLSAGQGTDRGQTLSGAYPRLWIRHSDGNHLLLICPRVPDTEQAHSILTQALLWMGILQKKARLQEAPIIHLLVPAGRAAVLSHRASLVSPAQARVEVLEYTTDDDPFLRIRHPPPAPPPLEERDFRWPVIGPFRWSTLLARVMNLAPGEIQRYPRFHDYDSLRLRGLEFAKALGPDRDHIRYGIGSLQSDLGEENFAGLRDLVAEILYFRRPDSPAPDHPYYRMQAERWLECLLLQHVPDLFPELVPEFVYPQVPVYLGKIPGRVDILGADRRGNLVVMELKVSEDPEMPLQALDYWGRVIHHNLNGDFESRGYFPGIRLTRTHPRIYLVSPVFSFHDTLESLLRCLDTSLEVTKIAINEDWRAGVKILRRTERTMLD